MLDESLNKNGGHFIGQNWGTCEKFFEFFLINDVPPDNGNGTKSYGKQLSTKAGKKSCEKIARFGGSTKRLRAKTGLSFVGSALPKPFPMRSKRIFMTLKICTFQGLAKNTGFSTLPSFCQ